MQSKYGVYVLWYQSVRQPVHLTFSDKSQKMMRRKKEVISSKLIVGFLTGALLGIIVSWVVNCALAEISLNPFFSLVRTLSLSLVRRRRQTKRNHVFHTVFWNSLCDYRSGYHDESSEQE